jgi:hypothetical protein
MRLSDYTKRLIVAIYFTTLLILTCLFLVSMSACGTLCTPTNIAVPVLVDLPDFPARPELQIKLLVPGDTADKALSACGADINMLLGREAQWEEFLKQYKTK